MIASKVALFIIDIQNDLATDPNTRIPDAARIRDVAARLLAAARRILDSKARSHSQQLSLIVFVQHEESPQNGRLLKDTEPWKLVFYPRAAVDREWSIPKTTRWCILIPMRRSHCSQILGNTFASNAQLANQLVSHEVTDIVALGIQSECCVQETCKGALNEGFNVTILHGAHSTYDSGGMTAAEIEQQVEGDLSKLGVDVVGWEEWILRLRESHDLPLE
jgi:nicotinamidase-related amidase